MEYDITYWKNQCERIEHRNRQLEKEIIRLKGGKPPQNYAREKNNESEKSQRAS